MTTFLIVLGAAWAAFVPAAGAAGSAVQATAAYREAFGPPPDTEGAPCTAAVVFFPGAGVSGSGERLAPLPVFLLNPENAAEQAARVAVEGYPTAVREFRVSPLFPRGSKLRKFEPAGETVTVDVTVGGEGDCSALAYQGLAHTMGQFGLRSVVLRRQGCPAAGPLDLQSGVLEPPPPVRLLDVVAPAHAGEKPVEIDVLFDRPVAVSAFSLRRADGAPLPGKTYLSMFDMAVVFRPEDPGVLREDLPLEISWTLRDRNGGQTSGRRAVRLRLFTHPE